MKNKLKFKFIYIIVFIVAVTIVWLFLNPDIIYEQKQLFDISYQDVKAGHSIIKLHNNEQFDFCALHRPCEIFHFNHETLNLKQLSVNTQTFSWVNKLYSNMFYNKETNAVHFVSYPQENSYSLITIKDDSSLKYTNEMIYTYDVQEELKAENITIKNVLFYPYTVDDIQDDNIVVEIYKDGIRLVFSDTFLSNGFNDEVMDALFHFMNKNLGSFSESDVYKMKQFSNRYNSFKRYYGKNYKTNAGYFHCNILGMIDCNNDKIKDFLFCLTSSRFIYNRIFSIDGVTKEVIWEKDYVPAVNNTIPTICDIDEDGKDEILIAFYSPGFELPIDIMERDIFGTTKQARFMILENTGDIKQINGKSAVIETEPGFYDFHFEFIEESGKILLGLKSEFDKKQKKLMIYDTIKNVTDTLDISYQHIIDIRSEDENIVVFEQAGNLLIRHVLSRELKLIETFKTEVNRDFRAVSELNITLNNKEYYLFTGSDISLLIDKNYETKQNLDIVITDHPQFIIDDYIYGVVKTKIDKKLVRIKITRNRTLNPYVIILFLAELMLLLTYFLIKQYVNIPMKSINNSYFVQYQIMGRLYYWKLFGKLANINKQHKRISTNKETPNRILNELTDEYEEVYQRNFFLLKYRVFEIKSADEFAIIQRISHDLKNQVLMTKLMTEQYETKLHNENEKFMNNMSSSLHEISSSAGMLSNFSHINKLYKEEVALSSFINEFLKQYINHPMYDRIEFSPVTVSDSSPEESYRSVKDTNVRIDKALFTIALKNLINNALEAIDDKGYVKIRLHHNKAMITMEIKNSLHSKGASIQVETCMGIGYSTKETGSGLGIPISKSIIEKHGGTLEIETQENEFVVKIVLATN